MKITDIAQAASVQPKAGTAAKESERSEAAAPAPVADKVRAKGAEKVADAVAVAQAAAATTRSAKLEQLRALISSGNYHPDAQRIADQILNAAQIDAALRSMLQ